MREQHRVGVHYLEAATALLRRVRSAHPTVGLYEAADLHWWWRTPRSTDDLPQLFWFDHLGRPEAAVIGTDWGDGVSLDPIVMPDATPDWVAHVVERGLAHATESGLGAGIDRLARAGAERIKIVFRPENPTARGLYLSVGFEPAKQTAVLCRRTSAHPDRV